MNTCSRARLTTWAGAMMCAGIIALAMASLLYHVGFIGSGWGFGIDYACIHFDRVLDSAVHRPGWACGKRPGITLGLRWLWPRRMVCELIYNGGSRVSARSWWIPLWMPLFLTIFLTVLTFRSASRHRRGYCRGCGYNLVGNTSGRCPECGRHVTEAEQPLA